jgi:hypothetical protein
MLVCRHRPLLAVEHPVLHASEDRPHDVPVVVADIAALDALIATVEAFAEPGAEAEVALRAAFGAATRLYLRHAALRCPCRVAEWFLETERGLKVKADALFGPQQLIIGVSWTPIR